VNPAIASAPTVPLTPALVDSSVIRKLGVKVNWYWLVWVAIAVLILSFSGIAYALSRLD